MKKAMYAHTRKSSKKPLVAAIALILSAASLIGGAFAWTDFSQSKTNKFRGTYDADVSLHDEFDGENKDVFVENSGTNPIYVRVRLDEFMKVGDTQFDPNADIYDKTTWTPHTYDGNSIEDCDHADDGKFHSFYEWTMSGRERNYKPGTPGMVYDTLGADGKVDESGPNLTAAESMIVLLSDVIVARSVTTPTAAQTAILNAVTAGCWILDDTDSAANGGGWAYWSQALQPAKRDTDGTIITPGQATNLLLDEVKLKRDAESDWIYRIDVKLHAVTLSDTEKWNNTDANAPFGYKLTNGAREMIAYWNSIV